MYPYTVAIEKQLPPTVVQAAPCDGFKYMFASDVAGVGPMVDVWNSLLPWNQRSLKGTSRPDRFRDCASLVPLVHNVQQPDYRPLYFLVDSRQQIKDNRTQPRKIREYDNSLASRKPCSNLPVRLFDVY